MLDIHNISKLGIGGWGLGGLATVDPTNNDAEQIEALRYSIDKGLNFIEVNFWNSEGKSVELIKKAIDLSTKKREDLFLSLVIYDYNNPNLADVDKEIEKYFALFETDYIDTLEFAFSAMHTYGFDNVVKLVQKYVFSGQARYTSITNANLEYLQKYHDIFKEKLFSHEVHYSFEVRDNEYLGIIDYAKQHGIKNAIYQPLRRNRTAARNWPLLVELADKCQKTQNQIILNWMVVKGLLPLVKSQNKAHIEENLGALDFTLSQEDIAKLDSFKVPGYKQLDIDWTKTGNGNTIFSLPNLFDELYPQTEQLEAVSEADEHFMRQAVELAKESRAKYKHAVGALLVKDGKVVATALSQSHNFHAELNCIHAALKALNTEELTDCTLYTTQESCVMCFGAALYANVDRLVFGAYAEDLTQTNTYEYPNFSLERFTKDAIRFDGGYMEVVGGVLRQECAELMADHVYWTAP